LLLSLFSFQRSKRFGFGPPSPADEKLKYTIPILAVNDFFDSFAFFQPSDDGLDITPHPQVIERIFSERTGNAFRDTLRKTKRYLHGSDGVVNAYFSF